LRRAALLFILRLIGAIRPPGWMMYVWLAAVLWTAFFSFLGPWFVEQMG